MQHTTEDQPQGREIEITHPGRVILSGPIKKRPALETQLIRNQFVLEKPRELPDGTMPPPGHGLPSHPDPLTAAAAGAPNSGHTPGTQHPAELHFLISPGDHKRSKVCTVKDCEHVGQTELRPTPLTEHIGKPYEDDPEVTFVTTEWQTPEQIEKARFIAAACGFTLRAVTAPRKSRLTEYADPPFVTEVRRELDVIREALGFPPRIAGGAVNTPAWAMQSGSHSAMLARLATSSIYNTAGGILNTGDYAVTAGGAMTVNIAGGVPGGQILIPRPTQPHAGLYYGLNDASVNLAGFTAPAANTWISPVYAQAEDTAWGDAATAFQVGFVTGAASSSPVAPSTPTAALGLANIAIPSTASSITTGMITSIAPIATINSGVSIYPRPTRCHLSSNTAIAAGWTSLVLDATDFDPDGRLSGGKYFCPVAGYYLLAGCATVNPGTSGNINAVAIYHNGSLSTQGPNQVNVPAGDSVGVPIADIVNCASGDTLALGAFTSLAGTIEGGLTYMSVRRV